MTHFKWAPRFDTVHLSDVYSRLISFSSLSASGSLEYARSFFENTAVHDPFLYNTMIRAYSQSIFPIEAINLYNQMQRRNVKSDNFTYPFVLKACARVLVAEENDGFVYIKKGAELHCRIIQSGLDFDTFIQNSLIFMYSQCGSLDLARRIFDGMMEKTVVSWNTMIVAYDRSNDFVSADFLFENNPGKNVVSWNTMITRHVKLGNIEAASRVFERMPERDAASWNSMMAGYIQSRNYSQALQLFHQMQINGVKPTEITIISVLGACTETGALEMGRDIHEFLKQNRFKIEGVLGNALLDMYAKCGSLKLAREIFDGMSMKHVSCWNSMIVALALHGHSDEALELFSSMEEKQDEARPNRVTFIGVLIACSHKGLVEAGRCFFRRMTDEYKIRPDIKHYGCMVDLLSRWGLLDEAHQVIKTMPFKANCVLWRTLLGACRTHSKVELAEEVCRKLAELEPLRDGDYVLLSNIYAEAERWEDVEWVRRKMIDLGVSKKPGCSQIEVK
ncbi:pentatricopeptide repeat-containing protein At1g74630-like isoform X1 [Magnolia sinica]|uniref:pentatricopeptide repeat-containing protein At1g74630-like isoform X1 n=1 Tax=Magnolia sinica TaxID=86752 RepID=UPI002658BA05|nr:pentatricopeptide repeat-containing protein At1g74630-like isoform X1 [Magnolia sinica]